MQISKFKSSMHALLFLVFFLFINGVVSFIIERVSSRTLDTIEDYTISNNIELLVLGHSLGMCGINPYVVEDILKENTFNMSTSAQPLVSTCQALSMAIKDHKLKKVALVITPTSIMSSTSPRGQMLYLNAQYKVLPKYEYFKEVILFVLNKNIIRTAQSITYFFPWTYERNLVPKLIRQNIKEKIYDYFSVPNTDSYNNHTHVGKGYSYSEKYVNFNTIVKANGDIADKPLLNSKFKALKQICLLCKKENIDLVVFHPPVTPFDIIVWKDANFTNTAHIKKFLKKYDIPYYDFNLIKPEIFKNKPHYFEDSEHLNRYGADAFSASFAKFLKIRETGEDMSKYFYTPEEWLASIDYISAVGLQSRQLHNAIQLTAKAYCGSLISPEYQFLYKASDEKDFTVVKEYGMEDSCSFTPPATGNYIVRVHSRKKGSATEYDRYHENTIFFQK